jgi:glycerol-3-phosphate acyltransferase PlsY
MNFLILLVIAYLLGGIPFGFLLVRWKTGKDVRSMGSGNIGATNVLRTTGRSIAVITLLLDIAKGVAAVWIADRGTGGSAGGMSAAALAVSAGQAVPIWLEFEGG